MEKFPEAVEMGVTPVGVGTGKFWMRGFIAAKGVSAITHLQSN
jgi:hypothetical protein